MEIDDLTTNVAEISLRSRWTTVAAVTDALCMEAIMTFGRRNRTLTLRQRMIAGYMAFRSKKIPILLFVVALLAAGYVISITSIRAEQAGQPETSERKSLQDSLPMTLKGSNYVAQKVDIPDTNVQKQEAIDAAIDAFMADNPQLSGIDEVRTILENENRAQTVIADGRSRVSPGEYRDYSDRPLWMVELTSVPVGGGSCGPLSGGQCPPPGRAPYFKALVDAITGEVIEWKYQGFGPADPIWDSVNDQVRKIKDENRRELQESIERGELEPPATSTAAPPSKP